MITDFKETFYNGIRESYNFKYYMEHCLNFRETSFSHDIEKPWNERCRNFDKNDLHSSINTCWNCANKTLRKIKED